MDDQSKHSIYGCFFFLGRVYWNRVFVLHWIESLLKIDSIDFLWSMISIRKLFHNPLSEVCASVAFASWIIPSLTYTHSHSLTYSQSVWLFLALSIYLSQRPRALQNSGIECNFIQFWIDSILNWCKPPIDCVFSAQRMLFT